MTANNQQDKIEMFHDALIQHGPLSNRIYLMKIKKAEPEKLIKAMDQLAVDNGYTKIFAKIPAHHADVFLDAGYQQEATVPAFYHGQEAAVFLGRYLDPERQEESSLKDIQDITDLAINKSREQAILDTLPQGTVLRLCTPDDAGQISSVYREVFSSYPFPIYDPQYIADTMQDNIVYFGVEIDRKFMALSSSEMDTVSKNVEMTDFATLPKYRGKNLSGHLLRYMENEMRNRNIQTAYTIARAVSAGMNITFAKAGYTYGGRLINNTNIAGRIESMNVWYKSIQCMP